MTRWMIAVIAVLGLGSAEAQQVSGDVCGTWQSADGYARVQIERCGGSVCGAIAWMQVPNHPDGTPKRDEHNDNPSLRERTLLGLPLMWGFRAAEDGRWADGRIYNPKNGNTYRAYLEATKLGRLKVSGCLFIFCGSETWTLTDAAAADC